MANRADPLSRRPPARGRLQVSLGSLIGFIALVALEFGWLAWFLDEPLPNAGNVGGRIRRSLLLWRALPEVIPGVRFHESYLGLAWEELRHVEHLPQRGPIVLVASLIAAAAIGLGHLVLRGLRLGRELRWFERLPLAYGLGTTGLGLLTLGLGRLGWLDPWPIRIGLGVLALIGNGGEIWAARRSAAGRLPSPLGEG
ncbi:MAG: hypothetical protein IRY99_15770, partial [Isosphaeraceae bacterium]|nr:hypothetical protein [Isosphaeraceae bacterium]